MDRMGIFWIIQMRQEDEEEEKKSQPFVYGDRVLYDQFFLKTPENNRKCATLRKRKPPFLSLSPFFCYFRIRQFTTLSFFA